VNLTSILEKGTLMHYTCANFPINKLLVFHWWLRVQNFLTITVSDAYWWLSKKHRCWSTLSRPGSGKTLWTRGGGHYGPPPWFVSFGVTKSPKLNLGTFLAPKNTWKAILDNFRFLSLVRPAKINKYYSRKNQNFINFEFLCCYAAQIKAENMHNSIWA